MTNLEKAKATQDYLSEYGEFAKIINKDQEDASKIFAGLHTRLTSTQTLPHTQHPQHHIALLQPDTQPTPKNRGRGK